MKTENEMDDQELKEFEKQTQVVEDKWDKLEQLRLLLNNSRVQQMYVIKRSSKLGPTCPYYRKSLRLFEEQEAAPILSLLRDLVKELEDKHV